MANLYFDLLIILGFVILSLGLFRFFIGDSGSGDHSINLGKLGIKSSKDSVFLMIIGILLMLFPIYQTNTTDYQLMGSFFKTVDKASVQKWLDNGIEAYEEEQYLDAYYEFEKAAKAGNSKAQWHYGEMIYHGEGARKNEEKGLEWIEKSANNGYDVAKGIIGMHYLNQATEMDPQGLSYKIVDEELHDKARSYLFDAAESGEANGQYGAALMHYGVYQAINKAIRLCEMSANQGLPSAQSRLILMLIVKHFEGNKKKTFSKDLSHELLDLAIAAGIQGELTFYYLLYARYFQGETGFDPLIYQLAYVACKELQDTDYANIPGIEVEQVLTKLQEQMTSEEFRKAREYYRNWKPIYTMNHMHGHFFK